MKLLLQINSKCVFEKGGNAKDIERYF